MSLQLSLQLLLNHLPHMNPFDPNDCPCGQEGSKFSIKIELPSIVYILPLTSKLVVIFACSITKLNVIKDSLSLL